MLLLEYLSLLQVLLSIKSTTFSIKLNTTTNETATIKEPHKTNNSFQNAALSITFLPSVLPVERKNFYTLKNPLENKSSNLQHEEPVEGCEDLRCMNGGQCQQEWEVYSCNCDVTSYVGPSCQEEAVSYMFGSYNGQNEKPNGPSFQSSKNQTAFEGSFKILNTSIYQNELKIEKSLKRNEEFVQKNEDYGEIEINFSESERSDTTQDVMCFGLKTRQASSEVVGVLKLSSGNSNDFILALIYQGFLSVLYNVGTADLQVMFREKTINDDTYHVVCFRRFGANSSLQVDHYAVVYKNVTGRQLTSFNNQAQVTIGLVQNAGKTLQAFVGLISGLVLNGQRLLDLVYDKDSRTGVKGSVKLYSRKHLSEQSISIIHDSAFNKKTHSKTSDLPEKKRPKPTIFKDFGKFIYFKDDKKKKNLWTTSTFFYYSSKKQCANDMRNSTAPEKTLNNDNTIDWGFIRMILPLFIVSLFLMTFYFLHWLKTKDQTVYKVFTPHSPMYILPSTSKDIQVKSSRESMRKIGNNIEIPSKKLEKLKKTKNKIILVKTKNNKATYIQDFSSFRYFYV